MRNFCEPTVWGAVEAAVWGAVEAAVWGAVEAAIGRHGYRYIGGAWWPSSWDRDPATAQAQTAAGWWSPHWQECDHFAEEARAARD